MRSSSTASDPAIAAALRRVHAGAPGTYMFTDLTKTTLGDVQNRFFRFFVPVKLERNRLPTSLPEFAILRHTATLSDSPVTVAAILGGHWTDHNLAAITQVGPCNFRCSYCYVDFRHLSGYDSFPVAAKQLVHEFMLLRRGLAEQGRSLSILRLSGGEPLLAPLLVAEVRELLRQSDLDRDCVMKVESNLSVLRTTFTSLGPVERRRFRRAVRGMVLHATLHKKPHESGWAEIRSGVSLAVDLGIDLYPAIGGSGWSEEEFAMLLNELESIARGLAFRLAVRPFNLSYIQSYSRAATPHEATAVEAPSLIWERVLRRATGRMYLDRPRHTMGLR